MPNLLHLDSSADTDRSCSRAITSAFAEAWRERGQDHTVTYRDLHRDPLPHLPDASLHWPARLRPEDASPPAGSQELQAALIAELIGADVVVIGAPMYNYSLPSSLKAWVDFIHVPGLTAPFDVESQPMAGRPAVVITARGAAYDPGTPTAGWDHGTPVLELILGTALGMDVSTIATNMTLAETVPMLASQLERCRDEFEHAQEEARETAGRLAGI